MSWRELHIQDESQRFRADVVTNEFGDREYTRQCLDKNGKLLVFENAVSYSGVLDGMALEAFPDAPAAAPYAFGLVCADGRKEEKAAAQAMCEADPALVNAIAPKKPVDSTYLSPLQVALSTGWIRQVNWHT